MFYPKWTFSLTSLVLILSLCFIASPALAQFDINLSVGDDEMSVSPMATKWSMVRRRPSRSCLRRW